MKKKVNRAVKAAAVIGGVCVLGVAGYFGYGIYANQQNRNVMAAAFDNMMAVERVMAGEIAENVNATGVVYLKDEQSVYAETTARISQVKVEAGDKIKKGDVIAEYDVAEKIRQLEKQISQTEINISNQYLTLRSMVAPAASSTIKQLQTGVDNAEKSLFDMNVTYDNAAIKIEDQQTAVDRAVEALEKAEKTLEDSELLLAVGAISQDDYDRASDSRDNAETSLTNANNALRDMERQMESHKMNIQQAEKSLDNAKYNLTDAGVTLGTETEKINYEKQQNQIKTLEIDLEDLRQQLADVVHTAVSPIDGTVTSVNVTQGRSVDTSTVLITIADFGDLVVKSNISEYDIPKIAEGMSVSMTSDGLADMTYTGSITKIGDSASAQSGGSETVVPVEVTLDLVDGVLKPGFTLDMEITAAYSPEAALISVSSVKRDGVTGDRYVFAISPEQTLEKKTVTLGIISDMTAEVVTGLNMGELIIANPTDAMFDGMPYDMNAMMRNADSGGGLFDRMGGGMRMPAMGGNMGGGMRAPAGGGQGGNVQFRTQDGGR